MVGDGATAPAPVPVPVTLVRSPVAPAMVGRMEGRELVRAPCGEVERGAPVARPTPGIAPVAA